MLAQNERRLGSGIVHQEHLLSTECVAFDEQEYGENFKAVKDESRTNIAC